MRLTLVPGKHYDTSNYIIIKNIESYKKRDFFIMYGGTYYLLGDRFYRCPLEMQQIDEGVNKGKYYIVPQSGGPAIDIHLYARELYDREPDSREKNSGIGFVSHYPYYWISHLNRNEKVKVPEEIKETYKEIVKFIKRNSFPCKPVIKQRIWAGRHAVDEFLKGQLKFEWGGRYYTPILSVKKSK